MILGLAMGLGAFVLAKALLRRIPVVHPKAGEMQSPEPLR
jgi:hypothetical protein